MYILSESQFLLACLVILSYYLNYKFLGFCKIRYYKYIKTLYCDDFSMLQAAFIASFLLSPIGLIIGILVAACAEIIPLRLD